MTDPANTPEPSPPSAPTPTNPLAAIIEKTSVTSEKAKLDAKDHLVAWVGSLVTTCVFLITSLFSLITKILDSVADYLLPYLQQVPRQDRPAWLAIATFLVMGLVILNKRRISGPNYVPPPPVPIPLPVTNPTQPSVPAAQGQPPPPGAAVNTTHSAF